MSNKKLRVVNHDDEQKHEISDSSKLLWERFWKPMQAAASQMNHAISTTQNLLGEIILKNEGFSPDTHVFDIDRNVIVPRSKDNGK